MRIIQKEPIFTPITISLETKEEAGAFWDMLEPSLKNKDSEKLRIKLSNWFSDNFIG